MATHIDLLYREFCVAIHQLWGAQRELGRLSVYDTVCGVRATRERLAVDSALAAAMRGVKRIDDLLWR